MRGLAALTERASDLDVLLEVQPHSRKAEEERKLAGKNSRETYRGKVEWMATPPPKRDPMRRIDSEANNPRDVRVPGVQRELPQVTEWQ